MGWTIPTKARKCKTGRAAPALCHHSHRPRVIYEYMCVYLGLARTHVSLIYRCHHQRQCMVAHRLLIASLFIPTKKNISSISFITLVTHLCPLFCVVVRAARNKDMENYAAR